MSFVNPWQQDVPMAFRRALRRHNLSPTRFVLTVSVLDQTMRLWENISNPSPAPASHDLRSAPWLANPQSLLHSRPPHRADFALRQRFLISTSKFGVSQEEHSNGTPLGLHRVARKIGGGREMGTVFKGRQPVGNKWRGLPTGKIMHRILWLEGLEPGFNRGGQVDTFRRYVYLHGFGDESTLGQPDSHGCVHVAMDDLLPLFERVGEGTHVWIDYL